MLWQLALAQHPMYFLIKEDELCAERTPPWGAPDVTAYVERLRDNFAVLRRHPQLKIGFEWSGLELELLAQDAPEVFQEMLALAKQGKLTFYNGTYAQPHLQTLSSEANYRQFELGARVYQALCQQPVRVYAHQETSFNEQTPQLLKAFGIVYMVLPHFMATLVLEGAEQIFHPREGTMFVQGSEFARWRGLDGSMVDTYLREPSPRSVTEWLAFQAVKGQLRAPALLVDSPDMVAIDDDWLAERAQFDFVLLDEALPERRRRAPPRCEARIYANWSYIEGIRAEELARANWLAERAALRAEAMGALALSLVGRPAAVTESIWKRILTTQHHDVYCFCAPDLKRKSIGWLRQAEQQAEALTQAAAEALLPHIERTPNGGTQIVLFNTVPHAVAAPVTLEAPALNLVILDPAGQPVPSEVVRSEAGGQQLTFVAQMSGLGYASYTAAEQGANTFEPARGDSFVFQNSSYRALAQPDGTLASLQLWPSGRELLDTRQIGGGALAGSESPVPGSTDAGRQLVWMPTAGATTQRSALGARLTAQANLGAAVHVRTTVQFYNQLPWIDFTWQFDFEQASLGTFYDDNSKLRVRFPLAYRGQIRHDIAFGVTSSLEDRPFFPAGWVDIADDDKGLAYFHQGTLKHWVADNVLTNLIAWGEDTDVIGNRLGRGHWPKRFDQRLNGRHTVRAALYPHTGDWRAADVVGVARSFANPPVAYLKTDAGGRLPASRDVFALQSAELAATAVMADEGQVACRFYSYARQPQPVELHLNGMRVGSVTTLLGEALEQVRPFQIGQLRLAPER